MDTIIEVTIEQLRQNPLGSYRIGDGRPVAVTSQGVVLFYLSSGSDLLPGILPPTVQENHRSGTPVSSAATGPEQMTSEPAQNTATVTVTRAAELIGKHKSTISRAIKRNELDYEQSGSGYEIKIVDLALLYCRPDLLQVTS